MGSVNHRLELLTNNPVFAVVTVIYHYIEIIWIILVTPNFCIKCMITKQYYGVETVDINIQSIINII